METTFEKLIEELELLKTTVDNISLCISDLISSLRTHNPDASPSDLNSGSTKEPPGKIPRSEITERKAKFTLLSQRLSDLANTSFAQKVKRADETKAVLPSCCPETLGSKSSTQKDEANGVLDAWPWPLSKQEYKRYGRQLIMPEIGLQGQMHLKDAAVLIVGVGGLGCPAATYLAGAGVGKIGLVDGDDVEISNLHRQTLHSTDAVGMMKVDSAIKSLEMLNPGVKYVAHRTHLTPQNACDIFKDYDLVLDCTDHPTSRYLISDTAMILRKPLVSASALRTDGQLMVLNYPAASPGNLRGGPCYRCIFPKPPPAESVISCGDGGILGPVVGCMGVIQALEAIKIITSPRDLLVSQPNDVNPPANLLIFSAYGSPPFRSVRLRGRKPGCPACSSEATITASSLESGSLDYVAFCGVSQPLNILSASNRISALEYEKERTQARSTRGNEGTLIDVREKVQFDLCSIRGSFNIPYSEIATWKSLEDVHPLLMPVIHENERNDPTSQSVRFICRVGNDSQLAVKKLHELNTQANHDYENAVGEKRIVDIAGGLTAWKRDVDHNWPEY